MCKSTYEYDRQFGPPIALIVLFKFNTTAPHWHIDDEDEEDGDDHPINEIITVIRELSFI